VASRTRIWLTLWVASLLWSSRSRAETFTTSFEAPSSCPDQHAFQAEVLARARSVDVATTGKYEFGVVLLDRGTKIEGTLTIRTRSGNLSIRRLEGISCAEVTSAFALIAALTLDPKARAEPIELLLTDKTTLTPVAPTTQRAAAEAMGTPSAAPASTPTSPPSSTSGVAASDRPTSLRPMARQTGQPRPFAQRGLALSLGAELGWLSAIAPNGMLLAGAAAEGRSTRGLVVRLLLGVGPASNRGNGRGEFARFLYVGGDLDVGWQVYRSEALRVDAALQVSLGDLEVTALERGRVTRRAPTHSTYLALGPALCISRTWSRVGLGLVAALPVALNRPAFDVHVPDPERFSTTSLVGAELALVIFLPLTDASPAPQDRVAAARPSVSW
jgi:hypothetical protein